MQSRMTRRDFFKLGAGIGAFIAGFGSDKVLAQSSLKGKPLIQAGRDISPTTRKERQAIASACWQCVARDGIIGYVEDGRLVKIEGNPKLPRTNGVICARGQAGVNQVYDPDRILYPMKRVGKRGEGKFKRITWEQAFGEIVLPMKKLREEGKPEKLMFQYGRMKASSSKIIQDYFLNAYGTGTIGNHTSICEGVKWTAQELTWGAHYDINDVLSTNFIVNFGSNVYEAHTSHIPFAQRVVKARAERGVPMVTFDVRLSNSAARSDEWMPVRPGTDGAVILAMANYIMQNELYDKEYIETWTNVTVQQLKDHLKQYTSAWAEGVSGVPAQKIEEIAYRFATAKPGTVLTYRGLVQHYNGIQNERAAIMLEAICGYLNNKGGRLKAVGAKWKNSYPTPPKAEKKLKILDGENIPFPTHHVSNQILRLIKEGKYGRPEVYINYCYNPVYSNGDCKANIETLSNEEYIPLTIFVDPFYSDGTALADIILPDVTYLERWDWEDMVSYDHIPEYYIRQPLVKPLGESRDFKDVCIELAKRIGGGMEKWLPFASAEEFVKDACENTPGVKEAGGFEYMKKNGAWYDPNAKPQYSSHAKKLSEKDLEGTTVDKETGIIFKGEKYDFKKGTNYVGQMINGVAYLGFKPDKVGRHTGKLAIFSDELKDKGLPSLPSYVPIPEHKDIKKGQLILTTYKRNLQTQSRTPNCKYLTELYHKNPAWVNTATAKELGIKDGQKIKVKSSINEITTVARVTDEVAPGIISISHHCGHWEYGRYSSGRKAPEGRDDDADLRLKWWKDNGAHPNWVIPNSPEPVAGGQRWFDTVVTVTPAKATKA